jgi:hypothetical protein
MRLKESMSPKSMLMLAGMGLKWSDIARSSGKESQLSGIDDRRADETVVISHRAI